MGNRETEARPSGTTTYTYDDADRLLTAGAARYGYDQNGNQTEAPFKTLTYDLENRLKTWTHGGASFSYGYGGDGTRLSFSDGGEETRYLWDANHPLPQLALELDENDDLVRGYVYGLGRTSLVTPGNTSFYVYDGLGSVANTLGESGNVQKTYSYEPFGLARTETGGGAENVMKFTGEQEDASGLYHLRARQYDPQTGRFLTRDPLGGKYQYAGSRPTVFADPSGLQFGPAGGWLQGLGPQTRAFVISVGDTIDAAVEGVVGHGHTILDVGGVVPVVGDALDAINCLWYGSEWDYTNAAFSCAAVVPVIGIAFIGAKWVRRAWRAEQAQTDTDAILRSHVASAVDRYAAEGMTARQARRAALNPRLEAAFRGERIDTFAKKLARDDPRLSGLEITGRFRHGPDFVDTATGAWWDITTPAQWPAHVARYGPGGTILPY